MFAPNASVLAVTIEGNDATYEVVAVGKNRCFPTRLTGSEKSDEDTALPTPNSARVVR